MIAMGIDPSTKCGVAVCDEDKILFTAEIEFPKLIGFERISAIVDRILMIKEKWKPEVVVIEEMFVGHASSAITIIQIGTVIRWFLWQDNVNYRNVHPGALKKFATGKGNAKKDQIMMAVYKKWGFESSTDNIADAVVLAKMGIVGI